MNNNEEDKKKCEYTERMKCKHDYEGYCTFITSPVIIKKRCMDYEELENE